MTPTDRVRRRRRFLLLLAAILTSLEVAGATLASAAAARAILDQHAGRAPSLIATRAEAQLTATSLTGSPADGSAAIRSDTSADAVGELAVLRRAANAAQAVRHLPAARLALGAELPAFWESRVGTARSRLRDDLVFDRTPDATEAPAAAPEVDDPAPTQDAADPPPVYQAPIVTLRLRIPDLHIDHTTLSYPCDRAAPPDNYVYRWGCAGANNLYLLGHASTVFRPLHDAYVNGQLWVGMPAWWTDGRGQTQLYRITSWRIVRPDQTSWAIASQPVPSMTLQTCYGADNEYRLLVRLVIAS